MTFTLTAVDLAYAQAELTPAQLNLVLSATYLEGTSGMLILDEIVALRAQEGSAAITGHGCYIWLSACHHVFQPIPIHCVERASLPPERLRDWRTNRFTLS